MNEAGTPSPRFTLAYPVINPVMTQRFGENRTGIADFYSRYGLPGHEGVDFAAVKGDPVMAAADGEVLAIRIPGQGGVVAGHAYGKHVLLKHVDAGGQEWQTQYCHLDSIAPGLHIGQMVSAGERLGAAGNTGNVVRSAASDGTHLHFMLRKAGATARGETAYPNDLVDPEPYFTR